MSKAPKKATAKKKPASRGLGRGLAALMSDVAVTGGDEIDTPAKATKAAKSKPATKKKPNPVKPEKLSAEGVNFIPIARLDRNPDQPRKYFDKEKLQELTRSIKDKGVLQPILVRPIVKGRSKTPHYQIVAGERRWQAALKAGLDQMPVMVKDLNDQEVLEIGVVENVQRANLNPIEEAQAYKALSDEFGRRQEDIAQAVGKSRSHVANMMRLLTLPTRAQDLLAQGKLTAGHARAVIAAPDPAALAEMIVQKDLSVRDAEAMMRRLKKGEPLRAPAKTKSADIRKVEKSLTDKIGLKVDLNHKNPAGRLVIHYKTADQLEDLIKRLPKGFE